MQVFQHLQGWIHRAWAGPVVTAHALFERTDDVVAVARLILEQLEDDVLEITPTEEAFAWATWAEAAEAWTEAAAPAPAPAAERPVAAVAAICPAAVWSEKATERVARSMFESHLRCSLAIYRSIYREPNAGWATCQSFFGVGQSSFTSSSLRTLN